tara:strand:+ start:259 stop:453 length:195 start_codon:yes stop_codon:yes gene_type:complete
VLAERSTSVAVVAVLVPSIQVQDTAVAVDLLLALIALKTEWQAETELAMQVVQVRLLTTEAQTL